jgi:MFS family permease
MKYIRPILVIVYALLGLTIFNLHSTIIGVFLKPLVEEFGWARGEVASLFSLSSLISALFMLIAGVVFDWRGGRIVIIIGCVAAALGGYGLSTVNSLDQFKIWYYLFSIGGALFGGIVPLIILANWFVRLRGIFIGVVISVASLGTIVGPPLASTLIYSIGWRTTYFILGLLSLLLILLAIFIKRRPEDDKSTPDFGMVTDRATLLGKWSWLAARRYLPSYDTNSMMAGFKAYPLTYGKNKGIALGILSGLFFLVITVIAYSSKGGIMVHLVPNMLDAGVKVTDAAISLALISGGIPIGALFLGVFSDFLHSRLCLTVTLACFGVGILIFNANPLSVGASLLMGFGQGGLLCMTTVVLTDYFGRRMVGSLRGFICIFISISIAVGPLLLGYIYDTSGSYSKGFIGMGVGVLLCALLTILMWPPRYEKLPVV